MVLKNTYKNGDFPGGWCKWHCFTHMNPLSKGTNPITVACLTTYDSPFTMVRWSYPPWERPWAVSRWWLDDRILCLIQFFFKIILYILRYAIVTIRLYLSHVFSIAVCFNFLDSTTILNMNSTFLDKPFIVSMGDLQDPKIEVLYHIFGHILWGYSLT